MTSVMMNVIDVIVDDVDAGVTVMKIPTATVMAAIQMAMTTNSNMPVDVPEPPLQIPTRGVVRQATRPSTGSHHKRCRPGHTEDTVDG